MDSHDISVPWANFLTAYRTGDDITAVKELRRCIHTWDDAFWANDFSSFPAVYTNDVVITNRSRLQSIIAGPQTGIEGFARLREDIVEAARFFRFDVEEVRRASGDRLVALGHLQARSRYAGLVVRTRFAAVWTLRADKICRAEGFSSQRAALKAAGLTPGSVGDEVEWDSGGLVHEPDQRAD